MMSTRASTAPNQDFRSDDPRHGLDGILTPGVLTLIGLLAIQLLLALGLGWTGKDLGDTTPGTPLLPFTKEQISRIEITQPGQEPVALERQEEGWVLPGLAGFPAEGARVDGLLAKLAELERRLPVATSDAALERFKVADDAYERQLIATTTDGTSTELLFGDSPGFRRIFVRPADETAVYEVSLAVSEIAAKSDDWTDKGVLQLRADEIQGVRFPSLELTRGEDGWQLQGVAEQEPVDTEKVDQLIRTLSGLSFTAVRPAPVSTPEGSQDSESESVFAFQLTLADDGVLDYRVVKNADGEHILTVSSQPHRFVISQYQAEQLLEQDLAGLLDAPEPKQSVQSDSPAPIEQEDAIAPTDSAPHPPSVEVPR